MGHGGRLPGMKTDYEAVRSYYCVVLVAVSPPLVFVVDAKFALSVSGSDVLAVAVQDVDAEESEIIVDGHCSAVEVLVVSDGVVLASVAVESELVAAVVVEELTSVSVVVEFVA